MLSQDENKVMSSINSYVKERANLRFGMFIYIDTVLYLLVPGVGKKNQRCGSGYVFYGSGSKFFFLIRFRIQVKTRFFKGNNKFRGKFLFSSKKVGIY